MRRQHTWGYYRRPTSGRGFLVQHENRRPRRANNGEAKLRGTPAYGAWSSAKLTYAAPGALLRSEGFRWGKGIFDHIVLLLTSVIPLRKSKIAGFYSEISKMEDPDLILTVTAADLAADNALSLLHNQSRYEPEDEVGDYASRQSTPFPDIEDNSCRLQLKFDRRPKDIRQGFVFGTDPRTCDVLIGTKETSISRRHFCITFDGDGRLVLKDISKCGTAVSYNGQAEREVRQHFTWILFKGYELKVHLQLARKRFTAFMITVANHEDCKAEYQAHLRSYLDDSRNAVPPLGLLNIHSQASTRAPTQPLSPRQRPIYLQGEELGSGTFGAVYRATDVSTGDFFAAKRFNTKSGFEMEVEILKSVCHVSLPHC